MTESDERHTRFAYREFCYAKGFDPNDDAIVQLWQTTSNIVRERWYRVASDIFDDDTGPADAANWDNHLVQGRMPP